MAGNASGPFCGQHIFGGQRGIFTQPIRDVLLTGADGVCEPALLAIERDKCAVEG